MYPTSASFWQDIHDFYSKRVFCDLALYCDGDNDPVLCHQLVLSPVSQLLGRVLRLRDASDDAADADARADPVVSVVLPGLGRKRVLHFVDTLYNALLSASSDSPDFDTELCAALQLNERPDAQALASLGRGRGQETVPVWKVERGEEAEEELFEEKFHPVEKELDVGDDLNLVDGDFLDDDDDDYVPPSARKRAASATGGRVRACRKSSASANKRKRPDKEKVKDEDSTKENKPKKKKLSHAPPQRKIHVFAKPPEPEVKKEKPAGIDYEQPANPALQTTLDAPVKTYVKQAGKLSKDSEEKPPNGTETGRRSSGRRSAPALKVLPPTKIKQEQKPSATSDPSASVTQRFTDRPLAPFEAGAETSESFIKLRRPLLTNEGRIENVDTDMAPFRSSRYASSKSITDYLFRAVVGLKKTDQPNEFEGRALARHHLLEADLPGQFEASCAAFKSVYGLSDIDLYCQCKLYYNPEVEVKRSSANDLCQRMRKKQMTCLEKRKPEELEAMKLDAALLAAELRATPKPHLDLQPQKEVFITFNDQLQAGDFDGVGVLLIDTDMSVKYRTFQEATADAMSDVGNVCISSLLNVWSKDRIVNNFLNQKYVEFVELSNTRFCIETLLNPDKPTWTCHECGKSFVNVTKKEKSRITFHKDRHYVENFECDCGIDFKSYPEKREHVKLKHSDGRYTLCPVCKLYFSTPNYEKHVLEQHKTFVCDHCGKQFANKKKHDFHTWNHHKLYNCRFCGEVSVGYNRHFRHEDTHRDAVPCETCGKQFNDRTALYYHSKSCSKSTMPGNRRGQTGALSCQYCGKAYTMQCGLTNHVRNVHLRQRDVECSYGCGKMFKTPAHRDTHEKKTHGGMYPGPNAVAEDGQITPEANVTVEIVGSE